MEVKNIDGKTIGKIDLPPEIFAVRGNDNLVAQGIRVVLTNRRRARAKAKTRGEVSGSGRKIYRQKGTGRARHGDRYAPIFVGGGVAHGPTGGQKFVRKMSRKMRQKSLFAALTKKKEGNELVIVDGLETMGGKTNSLVKIIRNLSKSPKMTTIVASNGAINLIRATRNVQGLDFLYPQMMNAYAVLRKRTLIVTKEALGSMEKWFLGDSKQPRSQRTKQIPATSLPRKTQPQKSITRTPKKDTQRRKRTPRIRGEK